MNYDDEEYDPYAGFGGGCPVHGEDYMHECTVCGAEFCSACFPNSDVCEECAEEAGELDDEERFRDADADELKIVAELAPDDPELDQETEAALRSFGDLEDGDSADSGAPPSDDVFQAAEKQAAKAVKPAKKAAAKPAAKPAAKKPAAAKPKAKKAPAKPKK